MKLFAENGDGYRAVKSRALEDEAELQRLFRENPVLVPWSMDDRRVLVDEFPTEAGPIDLLGIDAQGQLVLIETKLERNTKRREVIAQALDYASQLPKYGPAAFLDKARERLGFDFTEAWFPTRIEREDFQRRLESNLRDGRFTLAIVIDHAEPRLKDTVRFLNRAAQFDCILAEVRILEDGGRRLVSVENYGEESAEAKHAAAPESARPSGVLSDDEFVKDKEALRLQVEARAFLKGMSYGQNHGLELQRSPRAIGLRMDAQTGVYWYAGMPYLQVWAKGSVLQKQREFLGGATEPWASRIEVYGKTKQGQTQGLVAKIHVKGATASEFEELFRFYAEGPRP